MSVTEADKDMNDFNTFTVEQKFEIANMLIAIAYNFPLGYPPPINKTIFEARNQKNGKGI